MDPALDPALQSLLARAAAPTPMAPDASTWAPPAPPRPPQLHEILADHLIRNFIPALEQRLKEMGVSGGVAGILGGRQ